ncbi:signal recognition particle-docking protein FtsY [Actinoplanes regularis]|uniref:Signal recognition particle receptor FtsY n=1 Tax=Actinoplanes regularis TaxID=52697 RepID=A0A238V0E6_9ACTN|nr:signal recognition particle-docking protein FtsY [Actinoplanes regularis]GIE84096.1 signal recognition particle receptor FtsY [Actinoplanes regularis]SNR28022.1 signal recognition particle-docking protein FtsY [Actinoplanes regularis]
MEYVVAAVILLVVLVVGAVGLVVPRMRRKELPPPPVPTVPAEEELPPLVEKAPVAETPVTEAPVIEAPVIEEPPVAAPTPVVEKPEPTAGRLVRLRARLARSQSALGRGLLTVLSRDHLEDDDWEEIEDSLITADVGVEATQVIVERLRERVRILGTRTVAGVREQLTEELIAALEPDLDRSLHTAPHDGRPAVLMVVGVNGAGKTTTCGKIGRVLIADGRTVLFGAADTFRAAATEQLVTWGERVGAETVRGPAGGDPASVAFDAVKRGIDVGIDTVVVDTAGRLQNKVGLMDELGKVKRVVEKHGPVDETLLVLDATTGQNGLEQARVFTEVVDVTGVVLTKLDGTAKGGIVIAVQRKLGIPVKLVGLGEGPDDLAPFEPAAFVEALLGETA